MSCPHPLPDPLIELLAGRLRVIADPTRIKLLDLLQDGEATVQQLTDMLDTTHQNVSKHLALLHQAGLVRRRRDGVFVHYAIADPSALHVFEELSSAVARQVGELARILRHEQPSANGQPSQPPARLPRRTAGFRA